MRKGRQTRARRGGRRGCPRTPLRGGVKGGARHPPQPPAADIADPRGVLSIRKFLNPGHPDTLHPGPIGKYADHPEILTTRPYRARVRVWIGPRARGRVVGGLGLRGGVVGGARFEERQLFSVAPNLFFSLLHETASKRRGNTFKEHKEDKARIWP